MKIKGFAEWKILDIWDPIPNYDLNLLLPERVTMFPSGKDKENTHFD